MTQIAQPERRRVVVIHPFTIRLTHWLNAFAITCMVMSGWKIYDASPLFPFSFPAWATLGGWLGGALAWHFAAMWLLIGNGLVYLVYGLASRHFSRHLLPIKPRAVWRDTVAALTFKLQHKLGTYNAVQRLLYAGVLLLIAAAAASGLALWKPVQVQVLTQMLGGYEATRRIHFLAMAGIVGFVVIHLALVILVPSTLWAMITGRGRVHIEPGAEPGEALS